MPEPGAEGPALSEEKGWETMEHKQLQSAELREISKLCLQTASLMQALLEARQQLQRSEERSRASEQRAAEAERHLLAVLAVEWEEDDLAQNYCPWCDSLIEHTDTCPRQAAAAWLEAGDK